MTALRRAQASEIAAIAAFQRAAYARNRPLLGVEPLPSAADYDDIFAMSEIWIADGDDGYDGILILQSRPDDLLIWSIATAPTLGKRGLGNRLLAFADQRAREEGRAVIRLYTGEALPANVAWYARHGFAIERTERLSDRTVVHMKKNI